MTTAASNQGSLRVTGLTATEVDTQLQAGQSLAQIAQSKGKTAADVIAAAGTAAVNCVELTNVVVGIVPPKLTIEVVIKLAPLMVRVKPAALPATALVGDIAVIVGTGSPPPPVEAVPPPHPARNPMFTIAEITSPLVSTH